MGRTLRKPCAILPCQLPHGLSSFMPCGALAEMQALLFRSIRQNAPVTRFVGFYAEKKSSVPTGLTFKATLAVILGVNNGD